MASRGRRDASQDNCTILVRLSKCWASPHKTQQTERAIQTQSNCRPLFERRKKQHTLTTRISHDGPTGNATGKQLTHETSGNPFLYYILSLFLSLWVRTLFYLGESPPGKTHTHGTGGVGWADRELSTASRVLNLYIWRQQKSQSVRNFQRGESTRRATWKKTTAPNSTPNNSSLNSKTDRLVAFAISHFGR